MAKSSSNNEIFDNSLCSKDCKKNTDSLNKTLKLEKDGVDGKLACLLKASKDLDNLIESQRSDKTKDGLGYSAVLPPPAQLYSSPKKDLSWTGLPKFKDDTATDYSRPEPTVESSPDDAKKRNPSVFETEASSTAISPKSFIKFMKPNDSPSKSKTDKTKTPKKPPVKKWVKQGTSRSQNNTHKSFISRPDVCKPYRPPMRPVRTNMNGTKLKDSVRTKRSRGSKSTEVVNYILQVKKKLLTKKLEDSDTEYQV
nr:hypothetical protein [Tanacetum cinerariifolium]